MTAPRPKPTPVPPVPFVRLEDLPSGSVTGLIYGGSKTAKTWILGTAGNRSVFIDTGDGIETLHSPLFKQLVGANPIVVSVREKLGPRGVAEVGDAYNMVCDIVDYVLDNLLNEFDFICCDELSAMRRFALMKGLDYNQQTGKSQTLKKSVAWDMIIPAVQDYGAEMSLIEQFCYGTIRKCKEAGKHFFVAAHQRYIMEKPKDANGNPLIGEPKMIKEIRPAVTGEQFPDTISALFDNVWRTERAGGGDKAVYRLRMYGDEQIVAGSRNAGVFPVVLRAPNLLKIVEHIKSGVPMKDLEVKPQPIKEPSNVPTVRA